MYKNPLILPPKFKLFQDIYLNFNAKYGSNFYGPFFKVSTHCEALKKLGIPGPKKTFQNVSSLLIGSPYNALKGGPYQRWKIAVGAPTCVPLKRSLDSPKNCHFCLSKKRDHSWPLLPKSRVLEGLKTKVMVHFVSHKHCPFLEYNKRSVTWSQMPNYPFVTFRRKSC